MPVATPALNQGDQGENLIPPSLILIPNIPNIPNIGVPWVPTEWGLMPSGQGPKATYPGLTPGRGYPRVSAGTAAAGQGHRGRGSVARLPQGQERGRAA